MFIDSHCHLDRYDDLEPVLERARKAGVGLFLAISTSPSNFDKVIAIAEKYPDVYAAVGVHPSDSDTVSSDGLYDWIVQCTRHHKVVAIGEAGLDGLDRSPDMDIQKEIFRIHIQASLDTGHPLVVHTRDTDDAFLSVMAPYMNGNGSKPKGVLHCFTGGLDCAQQAIAWGWKVSFSGIITFKNARAVQDMARSLPLSSLLVETDAPWLAPEPHRGQTNEPAYVMHTAAKLAALKDCTLDQVAQATCQSFYALFSKAKRHQS
jgi:TatD DNase family protein